MEKPTGHYVARVESFVLLGLLVFAAATILVAVLLVRVICSRRFKLRDNSFFLVCAIGYLFNSLSLVTLSVGKTFAALGWMPLASTQTTTTARIIHFALFFSRSGELHTTVFTALNRMMAILSPSRHEQVWTTRAMVYLGVYQLVIGSAVGTVGAISDASWIRDSSGGYYPQLLSDQEKMWFGGLLTCSIIFIGLISFAYAISFVKLRSQLRAIVYKADRSKSERSLTYVAVLTCAVEVLYYTVFAYVFLIAKDVENDPRTFHFILALQGNIASGIHPYLLLGFSNLARSAVRQYLSEIFNCTERKDRRSTATTPAYEVPR